MWQISRVIGMALLIGMSIEDIRFRKVSGFLLGLCGVMGGIYQFCQRELSVYEIAGGIAIGIGFLLFSYVSREGMGYGDSLLICILGVFVGAFELIEILLIAWFVVGMTAIALLVYRKFSRRITLPFVPFLTVGYVLVSIGTYARGAG